MEIPGKIFCSKFNGIFDYSLVRLDRKTSFGNIVFNITRSIGIFGKSSLNKIVNNDNSIWILSTFAINT